MSEIELSTVVSARDDLLSTQLSDTELVMLDADNGKYFGVQEVANTIWNSLSEPTSISAICDTLVATYDAERSVIEADALSFVGELVDAGLAVRQPGR